MFRLNRISIDSSEATPRRGRESQFTADTAPDVPAAMAINTRWHLLYVAGSSNNQWAIGRVNINSTGTQAWRAHYFTGTATSVRIDPAGRGTIIDVSGTTAAGASESHRFYAVDLGSGPNNHNGGDLANGPAGAVYRPTVRGTLSAGGLVAAVLGAE